MTSVLATTQTAIRLPKLAAMALVFLGMSTQAPAEATMPAVAALPAPETAPAAPRTAFGETDNQIHALSAHDAALYHAAFAAQTQSDWGLADKALAGIKDQRLTGHILADRYLRRGLSLDEAKSWMASYADLPQAQSLYDKARRLNGFTAAQIARPKTAASWSGNNGQTSPSGFRNVNDNDGAPAKPRNGRISQALRQGDPIKAREQLITALQRGTIEQDDASEMAARISASFFYNGETERARPIAHAAAASGAPLGQWVEGLAAWKQRDYGAAATAFSALAQNGDISGWDRAAAAFWAHRAYGRTGDKAQSRRWLEEAAKSSRSFYGLMAASLLGRTHEASWKMPELNAKNMALLSSRPAGSRALALAQVGRADLAESELRRLLPSASREMRSAALALAEKGHMASLTLQLAGVATNDNGQPYEAALYPLPPWQPSGGFKVDRALIYAVARHESQFDPDAVSQKGACGLMQLMPSTARLVGNDNHAARAGGGNCPTHLFDPATNMEMGQKYVRVLAGQPMIGDNLLLLLAAYNGGPGKLNKWLDSADRSDALFFVESLPVRETREYVQMVLAQYWMYRARLAEPETTVTQLAKGQWPRYALHDTGKMKRAEARGVTVASLEGPTLEKTR